MTTDASPINRYLIFDRCDSFRTSDKITFALQAGRAAPGGKDAGGLGAQSTPGAPDGLSRSPEKEVSRRFLVRTLDEAKRSFAPVERQRPPLTPTTDATPQTTNQSVYSYVEAAQSHSYNAFMDSENSQILIDNGDDLDAIPWDNPGAQASYWNWPIETLYQSYHVLLAIDFGESTFDVSTNGEVFADRIPSIISSLFHVLETTLRTRDKDVAAVKSWLAANIADEDVRSRALARVWDPAIYASVAIINAPKPVEAALPFATKRQGFGAPRAGGRAVHGSGSPTVDGGGSGGGGDSSAASVVPIFPPSHTRFTAFDADGGAEEKDNTLCSAIPILTRVDARQLMRDPTVVERLRDTLLKYENVCRQRVKDSWPKSNLSATLEYLIRTAPEPSTECHSIVLTTNTRSMFCSDTLSFLESVVRRKNLILSVVALNRFFAIDSPRLSPLAQFLSAVGGFAVQIDYWLALAATRLNSEWCHRFEGARCLAQQLFVHLVNCFPVAAYGVTQRHAIASEHHDRVVLYDADRGMPDFVTSRPTLSLLRAVAASRFNEGWSVLMDYRDESTAGHLVARYHHHFHRGTLLLHYEMDISRPAVYRRLLVSGTRALVEHFARLSVEDAAASCFSEAAGSWLTYLALLRLQVHTWVRAEQTMLELLNMGPRTTPSLPELAHLSSFTGVAAEWLNMCTISSVGLFVRHGDVPATVFLAITRAPTSSTAAALSPTAAGKALVRQTMLMRHRQIGADDDLTFVLRDDSAQGPFLYVAQFFPFHAGVLASTGSHGGDVTGIAGGFECRVSFFLSSRELQGHLLQSLVDALLAAARAERTGPAGAALTAASSTGKGGSPSPCVDLQLTASLCLANQQSLLLVVSALSPRRLELLSYYTEHLGPVPPSDGVERVMGVSHWGRSTHPQQQQPQASPHGSLQSRPPLGKMKASVSYSSTGPAAPPHASMVLPRTLRTPYVTCPWSLANARSFKWSFACEDRFDKFSEEVFSFFIMRRVHAGFSVLVCYNGCLKAVLRREMTVPGAPDGGRVSVFDLIESTSSAPASGGTRSKLPSAVDTGVTVHRFTTPYRYSHSAASTRVLTEDVAEDVHAATALLSCKVFSSHANAFVGVGGGGGGADGGAAAGGGERRLALLRGYRREGKTIIKARMESLLMYLQPAHMKVIELRCPRVLGPAGCAALRTKVAHVAASMGDRHMTTSSASFHPDVLRHLGLPAPGEGVSASRELRVRVSLLYPIRYSTITFIMIAEEGPEESLRESVVRVSIGFLDAALLHHGLIQRYSEPHVGGKLPECAPDGAIVLSIQHMLTAFASMYTARQLINVLVAPRAGTESGGEERAEALRELAGLCDTFDTCATEMDMTHLLRARMACGGAGSAGAMQAAVQEVLASLCILEACSLPPFPAVFIPAPGGGAAMPAWLSAASCGGASVREAAREVGALGSALPITFACCVSLEVKDEALGETVRECFWISSLNQSPAALYAEDPPEGPAAGEPTALPAPVLASARMVVRVFVKTVPCDVLDLCCSPDFLPPPPVVRNVLRTLPYLYSSSDAMGSGAAAGGVAGGGGKSAGARSGAALAGGGAGGAVAKAAMSRDGGSAGARRVTGADGSVDPEALDRFFRRCHDFATLPEPVERAVRLLVVDPLVVRGAAYALYSTFRTAPFLSLQDVVRGDAMRAPAASPTPEQERVRDGDMPLLFTLKSPLTRRLAAHVEGLPVLLRDIVDPALRSSPAFRSTFFPVEFTQQATSYRSVDPKAAALDVFLRCADEDHMCVLAAAKEYGYVFVPNAEFFGRRWILVQMDIKQDLQLNEASIYYFDTEPAAGRAGRKSPAAVSRLLRNHMYTKITQISQLHLLKQLREMQNASTELIPLHWGKQFSESSSGTGAARGLRAAARTMAGASTGLAGAGGTASASGSGARPLTSFYLRGTDALRIPIYYKLQLSCRRILNFVTNNSTRLELFQIYNREQCFVVADDEEGDTFHYIRLVFVKDLGHEVSPLEPSPRLTDTDRCPELVVQLFTATSNASIRGPLRKLQDFCYLLAVQELQGHLNYVNSISFNDLVFLQNQLLAPITIDVRASMGAEPTKSDVQLALSLLFVNLRENKFKLLDFQDGEQSHTRSVFVKHYLAEELRGSRPGDARAQRAGSAREQTPPQQQQHHQQQQQQQRQQQQGLAETYKEGSGGAASAGQRTMRFVKVVDGSTDVLCSCALRWLEDPSEPNGHILHLDRYLTKVPSERYINGESERAIMKQLSDLVQDTRAQLAFHALSRAESASLPMARVPGCCQELLSIAGEVTSAESSLLQYRAISLDDVSVAVFPYLVERLCGAVRSFSPRCCEGRAGRPSEVCPLTSFPWAWAEALQSDPTADEREFYIMCGYDINTGGEDGGEAADRPLLAEAHVLPYSLPELSMAVVTTEEHQMSALREHGLSTEGPVMPLRIVIRVSLRDGLRVSAFNMRDSDYLTRLLTHIVREMEEKSTLLRDVLMQRLGFTVPSTFNEADLARNCCGDATNVLQNKVLNIANDTYRRRVNNVRFRPSLEEEAEDLVVIAEGLYNRGLMVNYTFPAEDAIAVLFNERPRYTLADCERIVFGFVQSGVLVRDTCSALRAQVPLFRIVHGKTAAGRAPFNCRLAEVTGVPADALIACDYHRHVLAAHIIVEAQNARSEVAEVLAQCDALWRAGPHENVLGLARAIVTLQMKSKQVFGARLPDFSLRRERWSPDDDVLEPTLPAHAPRGPSLSTTVDEALRSYMRHLRQLYPAMCIIDLDPADPVTTGDKTLLNRLRCRYGKVTNELGDVMRFCTHLYYAVIPLVDLLRCKTMRERYGYVVPALLAQGEETVAEPITSSGLFVVEIGFQVVHYALDFFVVNGESVPLSVVARVAADFKQSLMFDSILYDASVRHIQERVRAPYGAEVVGYVDVVTAAAQLVKYFPSPPAGSVNIASVFRITDPRVMRLRSLPQTASAGAARQGSTPYIQLVPERSGATSLVRARTGAAYLFCGLIAWETAQMYIILSCEEAGGQRARLPNEDLGLLVQRARRLLQAQLLESTQQERLDAAWDKFLSHHTEPAEPTSGNRGAPRGHTAAKVRPPSAKELPSYDEFELLRSHCQRVVLQSYRSVLQSTVGDVEWNTDASVALRAARVLLPECVFHVLWRPLRSADAAAAADVSHGSTSVAPAAAGTSGGGVEASWIAEELGGGGGGSASITMVVPPASPVNTAAPAVVGGYDVANLFASNGVAGRVIFTLADNDSAGSGFLGMECWSMPGSEPSLVVEDISFFRKPEGVSPELALVTNLTQKECDLLQKFMLLMTNMLWSTIVPCSSQVMI